MTKKNSYSYSRDFAKREKNYESILKTGEAMLAEDKVDNVEILHELLDKLKTRWQSLTHTSHTKHERLTHAYTLANEFKNGCMNCVNNLADLEDELKQQVGVLKLLPLTSPRFTLYRHVGNLVTTSLPTQYSTVHNIFAFST